MILYKGKTAKEIFDALSHKDLVRIYCAMQEELGVTRNIEKTVTEVLEQTTSSNDIFDKRIYINGKKNKCLVINYKLQIQYFKKGVYTTPDNVFFGFMKLQEIISEKVKWFIIRQGLSLSFFIIGNSKARFFDIFFVANTYQTSILKPWKTVLTLLTILLSSLPYWWACSFFVIEKLQYSPYIARHIFRVFL